jgi:hypothetical protein
MTKMKAPVMTGVSFDKSVYEKDENATFTIAFDNVDGAPITSVTINGEEKIIEGNDGGDVVFTNTVGNVPLKDSTYTVTEFKYSDGQKVVAVPITTTMADSFSVKKDTPIGTIEWELVNSTTIAVSGTITDPDAAISPNSNYVYLADQNADPINNAISTKAINASPDSMGNITFKGIELSSTVQGN